MSPDSLHVDTVWPSPNHGERVGVTRPDMLVLHYTGMKNGEAARDWLCETESRVSAHYLVMEDGEIIQMVPEARRAWHAGIGSWRGLKDINSRSIGIEIVNPGHEHGYRDFPPEQIEAVCRLCKDCDKRWTIPARNVVAHSDLAPARKEDPGERFPWNQLFLCGIGHFVEPSPATGGRFFSLGDRGEPVAAYQTLLALYGYDAPITGIFDEATHFVTIAFQRHFRQAKVDGVADVSTISTLHRLLAALPESPFQRDDALR